MAIKIVKKTQFLISYKDLWRARELSGLSQGKFGELMGWSQQNQYDIESKAFNSPALMHEITPKQAKILQPFAELSKKTSSAC